MDRGRLALVIVNLALFAAWPARGDNDARLAVAEARIALAAGEEERARELLGPACLGEQGEVEACLLLAPLAASGDDQRTARMALAQAVTLDPRSLAARFALGVHFLERGDPDFAVLALGEALDLCVDEESRALVGAHLGLALLTGDPAAAVARLRAARPLLDGPFAQRVDLALALGLERLARSGEGLPLADAASRGPDDGLAAAGERLVGRLSAFPLPPGLGGRLGLAAGVDTHPSSAFLDDAGESTPPVLKTVLRGDLYGGLGGWSHSLQGALAVYRDQMVVELGEREPESEGGLAEGFSPRDLSLTLSLGRLGSTHHRLVGPGELELTARVGAESQHLDHAPAPAAPGQPLRPSDDPFGVLVWSVGGELIAALCTSPGAISRILIGVAPRWHEVDADRSVLRSRLELSHERDLLAGFALELVLRGRWDLAFHDPAVVKYDRVVAELGFGVDWQSPWSRLALELNGRAGGHFYLNARGDAGNSFRPGFIPPDGVDPAAAADLEAGYYDTTRQDLEWQAGLAARLRLWPRAELSLSYEHRQRVSNLDDLWRPVGADGAPVAAPVYGYEQDVVLLGLGQAF